MAEMVEISATYGLATIFSEAQFPYLETGN